ncbi:MAG TPA: hypothetical protein VNM92_18585 [Thermoanaerobaculia bacterium]|nr:hypothetical protein [Thermoanaerobaculia bacterium]
MRSNEPPVAQELLNRLHQRFVAVSLLPKGCIYVGGAVRDLLLGRQPRDLDIVTKGARSVAAEFARRQRAHVFELGRGDLRSHRVIHDGNEIDFTELTTEGLSSDLGRRDFTINAIALDPARREVVDLYGGLADLRSSTLRMIADQNLADDPLRILRGIRLACELGLRIEQITKESISRNASMIVNVAPERVRHELDLMLSSDRPGLAVTLLREMSLETVIFGQTLDAEVPGMLDKSPPADLTTAYAVLFHNCDDGRVEQFTERWRWSRDGASLLRNLVSLYRKVSRKGDSELADLRVVMYHAGEQASVRLAEMARVLGDDHLATIVPDVLKGVARPVFEERSLLAGSEIQQLLSIEAGPLIGSVKNALIEAQIRGKVETRAEAMDFVRQWIPAER